MRHGGDPRQGPRVERGNDGGGRPRREDPRRRVCRAGGGQRSASRPAAVVHHRQGQTVTGALAVVRYSLIELSRRRMLLVFFAVGAAGIVAVESLLKVFTTALTGNVRFGNSEPSLDPATLNRALERGLVRDIISVLGFFALLIAFGIGMTVIYHDLESGAAISIFSKPVSRAAFSAGKVVAAIVAMIAIVGALSIEARLVMFLFGTGDLGPAPWRETVAPGATGVTLMLLVMALGPRVNHLTAAVGASAYNAHRGVVGAR